MNTFKPTPLMISAAETLFTAMAFDSLVRPIVLKYQAEILAAGQWHIRPDFAKRLGDEIILEPKYSYQMTDENFAVYDASCKVARAKANLHVDNEDQCPLLVAEHQVIAAKHALIEVMFDVGKATTHQLLCAGKDKYEQYIDLCLKLLAPFVRNADQILDEIKTGIH